MTILLITVLLSQHSEVQRMSNGHPLQCRPSSQESGNNQDVFRQLNQYRLATGRPALQYDQALEECIEGHCHHMAVHGFFAHNSPEADASTPFVRARACGTTASGENIARGQANATDVMTAWKNSPGHNANMLSNNYTRVGCGFYNPGRYWGQLFGTGPVSQSPQNPPPPLPPPPQGGGGGTPPPSTPPAQFANSPAGPTSDPYVTGGNPPPEAPAASSTREERPPERKIVPAGMLKR